MRIKVQLDLKQPEFPVDERPPVLSLLKAGLTAYENGELFAELYDGSAKTKALTFAVGFPRGVVFGKEQIALPPDSHYITATFSSGDMRTGGLLFNALRRCKGQARPLAGSNTMTLTRLDMLPEPRISGTQLLVRMLSPVLVRVRDGKKEHYASVAQADFEDRLREQLARRFRQHKYITNEMVETFHFLPVKMRKTVVVFYGQKLECSVGTAVISGAPELLCELYENGLGTHCPSGFGLLQILQQSEGGAIGG